MGSRFIDVKGAESIETLLERSRNETVVLFNHDPHCPISKRAYKQMEQFDGEIALVDVSTDKQLTSAIENRTGIRHESPQVFVLRDGKPAWSASHFRITTNALRNAVQTASGGTD